jgi:hypothetical protein
MAQWDGPWTSICSGHTSWSRVTRDARSRLSTASGPTAPMRNAARAGARVEAHTQGAQTVEVVERPGARRPAGDGETASTVWGRWHDRTAHRHPDPDGTRPARVRDADGAHCPRHRDAFNRGNHAKALVPCPATTRPGSSGASRPPQDGRHPAPGFSPTDHVVTSVLCRLPATGLRGVDRDRRPRGCMSSAAPHTGRPRPDLP